MQLENHENFVYNRFGGFSAAMCTNTDTYLLCVVIHTYYCVRKKYLNCKLTMTTESAHDLSG